jgi:hypothetical protein
MIKRHFTLVYGWKESIAISLVDELGKLVACHTLKQK